MNYEEALETIRYEVDEECHCGYIENELRLAMAALEKQIPKKVVPYCKGGIAMACPECGTFQDFCGEKTLDDKSPFCYKCGQALDWSDTE